MLVRRLLPAMQTEEALRVTKDVMERMEQAQQDLTEEVVLTNKNSTSHIPCNRYYVLRIPVGEPPFQGWSPMCSQLVSILVRQESLTFPNSLSTFSLISLAS